MYVNFRFLKSLLNTLSLDSLFMTLFQQLDIYGRINMKTLHQNIRSLKISRVVINQLCDICYGCTDCTVYLIFVRFSRKINFNGFNCTCSDDQIQHETGASLSSSRTTICQCHTLFHSFSGG